MVKRKEKETETNKEYKIVEEKQKYLLGIIFIYLWKLVFITFN